MPIDWDYPQPNLYKTTVLDENIDSLGHSNNKTYTSWCEQAAWQHSSQLGLNEQSYSELQRAMAISEARYQYLAPSFVGQRIVVATWLTAADGRLTMQRSFQICNEDSGQCLFRGHWQLVCINLTSNKPSRMPKQFIAAYMPALVKKTD